MVAEARTRLDLPYADGAAHFSNVAAARELAITHSEGRLRVHAQLGTIDLAQAGDASELRLTSEDHATLQALRDFLTTRLATAGIACRWEVTGSRDHPHNLSFGTVERIDRISPSFTRISITGPDLWRFAEGRLHFRLLFGPNGAGWPHLDASGVTAWPGGIESWHRPVYTSREIHRLGEAAARLVFDVFRHEGGRVTAWTDEVALGETVAIAGPSGSRLPPASRRIDLVGDETAIPVIARILAGLAAETSGTAQLFVPSEDDVQSLRAPEGFRLIWTPRAEGVLPVQAGLSLPIPQPDTFSFFAGERDDMLAVRARLIEASAPKDRYHVAAYWSKALRP